MNANGYKLPPKGDKIKYSKHPSPNISMGVPPLYPRPIGIRGSLVEILGDRCFEYFILVLLGGSCID